MKYLMCIESNEIFFWNDLIGPYKNHSLCTLFLNFIVKVFVEIGIIGLVLFLVFFSWGFEQIKYTRLSNWVAVVSVLAYWTWSHSSNHRTDISSKIKYEINKSKNKIDMESSVRSRI